MSALLLSAVLSIAGTSDVFRHYHLNQPSHNLNYERPTPTGYEASIWPDGKVPGEHAGTVGPETEFCLTPNTSVADCKDRGVQNVSVPTLTPYIVRGSDAAVIISPGGGYAALAVDREGTDIAAWLNAIGISAFVLKYRVPARPWLPFGGAPLMDAQRAMGLVRMMAVNGSMPQLNSSKIGFMGFSAGAHLTGHLNVAWMNRSYSTIDRCDLQPCRPNFAMMIYPWESVTQAPVNATREMASALNVTAQTPTTMLVQAEDDPVHVENSLFYFEALKTQIGSGSELHVYPRGGHGYGRCTLDEAALLLHYEVCSWPDRGHLFLQTLGIASKTNKLQ